MSATWWKKLKQNSLARFGATVLAIFYLTVAFAEITAPYDPYEQQPNGSLLPPTTVYWRDQESGRFIGPHVYPVSQGPTFLNLPPFAYGSGALSISYFS